MDFRCQPTTGACVAEPRVETVDCVGETNGRSCGTDGVLVGDCSDTRCNYADVCDTEATKTCTFAKQKCQSDTCVAQANEVRNLGCTRSGPPNPLDACGAPFNVNCGVCINPNNFCSSAASSGAQTCTQIHRGCVSGACGQITGSAVQQTCTPANQDNVPCATCPLGDTAVCRGGFCDTSTCQTCLAGSPRC
jgi:hypothetical protein